MDRLLSTKLGIPRSAREPLHRRRVLELLAGEPAARLVLVSAPPGYGKTTALATWLAGPGTRSAWVTLDEADNDPVRFTRLLRAATAGLLGQGASASAPAGEGPAAIEVAVDVATALAIPDGPVALVLDDYHVITASEVHRVVALLLERLPEHARLAIGTRADPDLPLARLRARGELLEIRAGDLRFTSDEAQEYFARRMSLHLPARAVETLVARTEGWPAVLQLAALSLAGRPDPEAHVREFVATHRFVLDYVVEEVLSGLDHATQQFLLATCILDRLCGPVCDAVTGGTGGQAALEALERANLLIVPLDDERRWYRYHALFGDVLRARLRILQPDGIPELHSRASAWFEAEGHDDQAVSHGLRAGDVTRTARLVGDASLRRLNAGELATVRRWLDALPREVVRADAQLSASYAWCLALVGVVDGVAQHIADAQAALDAGAGGTAFSGPMIPTQLALLRSRLADLLGDSATAIAEARHARLLVPAGLPPRSEATLRGDASVLLGRALLSAGDTAGAEAAYADALPDLRAGGNVFAAGRATADLASLAITRGDPARALALCEAEIEAGPEGTAGASVWAAMARSLAELGQTERAVATARRAVEVANRTGDAPALQSAGRTLASLVPPPAGEPGDAEGTHAGAGRRHTMDQHVAVEALTAREMEVLRLVAVGRSNRQVAEELFVTVGTVKSHLHTISGKLGAANRVEAVALGRARGLL